MPEMKDTKALPFSEDSAAPQPATLSPIAETAETVDNLITNNNGNGGQNGRKGHNGHLTSGRLLARNTIWNLLGSGAPMIVAVFCIPILIRGLGTDRFGVLTLAWALIGYASL